MTEERKMQLLAQLDHHDKQAAKIRELLEGVEGVEQPLVSQSRSDKEPGDAEQRSVESAEAMPPP